MAASWYDYQRARSSGERGVSDSELVVAFQDEGDLHETKMSVGRIFRDLGVVEDEHPHGPIDVRPLYENLQPRKILVDPYTLFRLNRPAVRTPVDHPLPFPR